MAEHERVSRPVNLPSVDAAMDPLSPTPGSRSSVTRFVPMQCTPNQSHTALVFVKMGPDSSHEPNLSSNTRFVRFLLNASNADASVPKSSALTSLACCGPDNTTTKMKIMGRIVLSVVLRKLDDLLFVLVVSPSHLVDFLVVYMMSRFLIELCPIVDLKCKICF